MLPDARMRASTGTGIVMIAFAVIIVQWPLSTGKSVFFSFLYLSSWLDCAELGDDRLRHSGGRVVFTVHWWMATVLVGFT